jgi:cbb3-type cytochrome oxidase maturation protein
MNILLALIPVSLALLGIAIGLFAWAVRSGQFEDIDSAPLDLLVDEPGPREDTHAD